MSDPLVAVYDLDCSPVSFDYLHFLVGASLTAQGRPVHVLIVPGNRDGWRTNDHKPITDDEREWRVNHILVAAAKLAGMTVTVCPDRDFAALMSVMPGATIHPLGWCANEPASAYRVTSLKDAARYWQKGFFQPTNRARQFAGDWLRTHLGLGGRFITITLRETHTPTRNSNAQAWLEVARRFGAAGDRVAIIRDTETMMRDAVVPKGAAVCPVASCDLDVRLALYELADLNAGRSGGAFWLAAMAGLPYFMTGILAEPYTDPQTGKPHACPSPKMMEAFGLPPGEQLHVGDPTRRVDWSEEGDKDARRLWEEINVSLRRAQEMREAALEKVVV